MPLQYHVMLTILHFKLNNSSLSDSSCFSVALQFRLELMALNDCFVTKFEVNAIFANDGLSPHSTRSIYRQRQKITMATFK
jgi:hypothetical protein